MQEASPDYRSNPRADVDADSADGSESAEGSSRQRILAAAADVLGRNGTTKLSLSEVAAKAGASRPTLYR